MLKPDGTCIFNDGMVEEGSAVFALTTQMLALEGIVECEVNIFDQDESLLSSSSFYLQIEKSVRRDDIIQSSNEFTALQKMMASLANPLSSKKLLNFGDSIAAGVGNSGTGYAHLIAERNGMTVKSYAAGGTKIAEILTQLNNAAETEADYILLEGGYNDSLASAPTEPGALSVGYTSSLNTNTFCGAMESLLKTAQNKYPAAKIIFVIAHLTADPSGM